MLKIFFRSLMQSFNHETVVYFITILLDNFANWFQCEHFIKRDKEVFHLRHNMRKNWSFFVAEVISTLFEYDLNKEVKNRIFRWLINYRITSELAFMNSFRLFQYFSTSFASLMA